MRLVPLQWASLVVIALDAVVIVSGFVAGSPLLPRSANVVLTVISLALMMGAAVLTGGGYDFENPTLPLWATAVAVIALCGGGFLFGYPLLTDTTAGSFEQDNGKYRESKDGVVVRELTEEEYDRVMAANQRGWAGLAAAFAGGTFLYAGVRHRK
ncbi:hypothetical protein BBK82_34855 [Lentzea guizhouensis]|uniref:Uncharacterized protein n=1 Tax=Lentzea guizhouensis TaxID=1586287 RepID=A0A1B2HRV7_9PSEU|nr:hypothetical protein [Lentzea guizhouensis]ANZ40428.1 hypothetical protein BBK82_34855 [Lentzea guizhouensis]